MAPFKTRVVHVDWTQLDVLPKPKVGEKLQVKVAKAAIPIVLVPGIMGSRLQRADKSVV